MRVAVHREREEPHKSTRLRVDVMVGEASAALRRKAKASSVHTRRVTMESVYMHIQGSELRSAV